MKLTARLLCFMAVAGPVTAGDAFLWLDGVPGDSTAERHEQWIVVRKFDHATMRDPVHGQTSFPRLRIVKPVDRASPKLALACAQGETLRSGTVEMIRPVRGNRLRFLQWKLADLRVTSLQQHAGRDSDSIEEEVALSFSKVQWTYTEISAEGLALRDLVASWNLLTGTGQGGELSPDTDGDGLPDEYERLYGLDPLVPDATGDLDGDGMTNLMEFRAGTRPDSKDSVFRASASFVRPGVVAVQWTRQPGIAYRLLGAATLEGPFEFVGLIEATSGNGESTLEMPSTEEHRFFLVETN